MVSKVPNHFSAKAGYFGHILGFKMDCGKKTSRDLTPLLLKELFNFSLRNRSQIHPTITQELLARIECVLLAGGFLGRDVDHGLTVGAGEKSLGMW